MQNYYLCALTIFDCVEVDWRKEIEWALAGGWEGEKRAKGVPNTLLESFTVIESRKTAHVNFYRKKKLMSFGPNSLIWIERPLLTLKPSY